MTEETRKKVLTIMNLVTLLNSSETDQDTTGSKPTIIAKFFGNLCLLELCIYENGFDIRFKEKPVAYNFYLEDSFKDCGNDLDMAIDKLTELCGKWGVI